MSLLLCKDVGFKDGEQTILKEINIEIERGECLSIVGASGSGKSTLLKLFSDLISPTTGSLFYEGKSYHTYDPIQLRRKISYCIQLPCLFGQTVYDNLAFAYEVRKESPSKEKMKQVLESFGLAEDYLYKEVSILSGGEKQRVCLARTLMHTPDVLLLDEVTSALDSDTKRVIEAYIKELNKQGVTIIWVTHDLEQSETFFNRRLTVKEGKIEKVEVFRG